jgi:glycosyltransferase involved in cell wall biosynthesis
MQGDRAANERGRAFADLGRRTILEPLFEALQPSTALICWIDQKPDPATTLPAAAGATVTSCTSGDLDAALGAGHGRDLIWLRGLPSWHTVRAITRRITAHFGLLGVAPVVVVEGGPPSAAPLEQVESTKEGIRLALAELSQQLDRDAVVLWCATGRGAGAWVPRVTASQLEPWLERCRVLLEALRVEHLERIEVEARNLALFELLDQSQRDGTKVVRSSRFRLGTRAIRLARTVLRKETVFRPPGAIMARQSVVDQWRSRLATERRPDAYAPRPGALRVTYVLPELRLSGGALVVLQLVNELRLLGVDARVVALRGRRDRRREVFRWRLQVAPTVFANERALMQGMQETDIAVATHWTTAAWVRALVDAGRARQSAYLVQDYEPWFYPEEDTTARARVKQTYQAIPHKVVTSEWLRELLARDGYESRTIPLGLDIGCFYPRPAERGRRPVVLAMARPRTPRRAFDFVVATLAKVHEAMPDAEFVLFGEHIDSLDVPFAYRSAGVVTDPEQMARLYSSARVHFDGSDFQAFGLPALEAMACGTVSVLTDTGGVREYARDGENCLLVAPRDVDGAAAAIVRLLADEPLIARLRDVGFETSREHSLRRQARETLRVFEEIARSARTS